MFDNIDYLNVLHSEFKKSLLEKVQLIADTSLVPFKLYNEAKSLLDKLASNEKDIINTKRAIKFAKDNDLPLDQICVCNGCGQPDIHIKDQGWWHDDPMGCLWCDGANKRINDAVQLAKKYNK